MIHNLFKMTLFVSRYFSISLLVIIFSMQCAFAQDSYTSVRINIRNVTMTTDRKTISYEVFLQDIDATNPIAIPGFVVRTIVPQADLGVSAKTVTVTNASTALGATTITMTVSGANWLMKFTNANLITSYNTALLISETFPGTRIGTFNITNTDGSSFNNPQDFNLAYAGTSVIVKSTIPIFLPNTTILAPNASTPVPTENFTGFGSYRMNGTTTPITTPATMDKMLKEVNVFDMNGKKVLTQRVKKGSMINTSKLPNGMYVVDDNGTKTKLLKN